MKKIAFFGFISIFLIALGLISLKPVIIGMSFPFLLYLISSLFSYPGDVNLEFHRTISHARVLPGATVDISVSVVNKGKRLEMVQIEDVLPSNISIVDGSPRHILTIDKGEEISWQYSIIGKRGHFEFSTIRVKIRDRFGILPREFSYPTDGELFILPEMINVDRLSIRPRNTRVYSGEIPSRSGGLGVEFYGVREFQPGDPMNWINWRISARHSSSLFSNEFEQERVADVGIILDGRATANVNIEGNSIFDYSVLAAATLSNAFIKQGDRVSFLMYGQYLRWIYPGYGKYQRERIMRALSEAEPGHSIVFSYLKNLPTQIFPPKSQIILISTLIADDTPVLFQLRARGYSVLVIRPDPLQFEKSGLQNTNAVSVAGRILSLERNLQLKKLIQGGIRVVNWDVSKPLEQVIGNLKRAPAIMRSAELI